MKIFIVMLVSFTCVQGNLYAQNGFQNIDKKNILIGEKIRLTFILDVTKDSATVALPDSIPHFEIIEKKVKDSIAGGLKLKITTIDFTSFDSGTFVFPSLVCEGSKAVQLATTDSFAVNVGYMPMDKDAKPRDIKTIVEVDYTNWFLIKFICFTVLAFMLLIFIIWYIIKKLKRAKEISTPNKVAYKNAMKAIENLRNLNEQQKIEIKELHTSLANILKTYYGAIDNSNALSKTTNELLDKLNIYKIKATTAAQAKEALFTGDATKFAKYQPVKLENEEAINFIQNTIEEIELTQN